jgi:hypothetical protein
MALLFLLMVVCTWSQGASCRCDRGDEHTDEVGSVDQALGDSYIPLSRISQSLPVAGKVSE